jgi:ariadne-1
LEDNIPAKDSIGLECRHFYCKNCWKAYLEEQIISYGPNTISTKCMNPKCKQIVPRTLFGMLLSEEKYTRYEYFFLKSCVEQNPKYSFCPRDCGAIVKYLDYGFPSTAVHCQCGFDFCFACGQEKHKPCSCEELKKWRIQETSQDEAFKLIESTAKKCPHCHEYVTRNDGCNHMRCRCGKDWCWMCRKDWAPHGNSWYNCFQYEKSDAKSIDEIANKQKEELDKYMAFYQRYLDHQATGKEAEKKRMEIETKANEYQKNTNFDSSFIKEALDLLIHCRHSLKYFYVYQFYHNTGVTSELTVEQRNLAEHFTELLADLVFVQVESIDRDKLKNHINVTKKYMQALIEGIEDRL